MPVPTASQSGAPTTPPPVHPRGRRRGWPLGSPRTAVVLAAVLLLVTVGWAAMDGEGPGSLIPGTGRTGAGPSLVADPLDCGPRPSACGFPDETNTGVTPGTTLTPSGGVRAGTTGQVIENLSITDGDINVDAPNVTIRNVKITTTALDTWAIIIRPGASATIENVEIAGRDKDTGHVQYAILSQTTNPVTINRANLHHCADCIQGERVTVTNTYIHDLSNPAGSHVDGFQCNSSCEVTLRHNTIYNEHSQTAAIALFADFGTPRNSTIDNNLLAGGGYTLYAGTTNATGIQVTNNRFTRHLYPTSGYWGPARDYNPNAPGNTWTNNTWDDTGATLGSEAVPR